MYVFLNCICFYSVPFFHFITELLSVRYWYLKTSPNSNMKHFLLCYRYRISGRIVYTDEGSRAELFNDLD